MTVEMSRPPFDQNDPKYKCLCGVLHIRQGARAVAVLTNVFTAINIIFSLTRSSTVAVYTIMSASFSVVIFGSLFYGVYKEKRLYIMPYMLFQLIAVGLSIIILLSFIISIAVHSNMVIELAQDVGNVDINVSQQQLDAALAAFTVLFIICICIGGFIQAYFLEIIYSFYQFLRDREMSFNFNFEQGPTEFGTGPFAPDHQQAMQ
ncbi:unnamed protein product [Auanema sp. JU1783]|nr:unnamed protein product [Auanema sp. JU1783]